MTLTRSFLLAPLCLLLFAAGCGGDDNQALSYDETGTEVSEICQSVEFSGLTGEPENDAAQLEVIIPDFEAAIEDVRELEVDEELETDRDAFADNADEQLAIIQEAQTIAESGDKRAYREKVEETQPLDRESDLLASRLGASGCLED
ncbi:MAG TPA: hypothetical protein VD790_07495 [Thermoleophilaceae bacterium]|nr:hypothetical protein [Thermoleophilaceae bacterium]